MKRRTFLGLGAAGLVLPAVVTGAVPDGDGETLYNGIRLPAAWPPRPRDMAADPVVPPYLTTPPAVVPIDLGRQLFVDDFLVAHTTLTRTHHRPLPHRDNPVLRPDRAWEREGAAPMAMPFSDGAWYDPRERRFKLWYMGGYARTVCLATSDDGIRWAKPDLGVRPGTNVVHPGPRDSATVWQDLDADPGRRFTLVRSHSEGGRFGQSVHFSADGIHWGDRAVRTGSTGDRTTAFYNPFRRVWVYSLRHGWGVPRRRRYWETRDLVTGPQWDAIGEPGLWIGADRLDPMRDDLHVVPQLYNLDCVAYESLLLGLFTIWRGDLNQPPGRPKPNDVCVGYSRDGYHWHRPDRRAFLPVSERAGDWNWGNVQSVGGGCLVVGDNLYFYHSGRAGEPGGRGVRDGGGSTGLAVLRRDGFVSMDAGPAGGTLTTRPMRFAGAPPVRQRRGGRRGADGRGHWTGRTACTGPHAGGVRPGPRDRTRHAVVWRGGDLAAAAGRPVAFRFHLRGARLYAFWVSRHATGVSQGYVAAGGPGLTHRDT